VEDEDKKVILVHAMRAHREWRCRFMHS